MFFILSKVLLFILSPTCWIILAFLWMLFSKSQVTKKRLRLLIVSLFIIFTNPYLFHVAEIGWQPQPVTLSPDKNFEAGIVLGGMSGYDKNDHGFFGDNADRFIQTANLYHQGIIKKILITGGTGRLLQNEPAESYFLKTQFINNGVKESDILLESKSRNTYENAIFTKKILDSLQIKPPYVLVTSAMHMPRSKKVFTKAGFDFIAFPCDYKAMPEKFSVEGYIIPEGKNLTNWGYLIKEIVGLAVYRLTGKA